IHPVLVVGLHGGGEVELSQGELARAPAAKIIKRRSHDSVVRDLDVMAVAKDQYRAWLVGNWLGLGGVICRTLVARAFMPRINRGSLIVDRPFGPYVVPRSLAATIKNGRPASVILFHGVIDSRLEDVKGICIGNVVTHAIERADENRMAMVKATGPGMRVEGDRSEPKGSHT